MIDKIDCKNKYGCDSHKYLIALLKQTQQDTSIFPTTITEEEYIKVRDNKEDYDEWYVGLVGFCATFGSKWFGGYARAFKADKVTPRNYSNEAIRNLLKQAPKLKDINFACMSFENINKNISQYVIYCDPPYRNTQPYATERFPYDKFYQWCRDMSKNNIVLISEYNMPNDFECIWSKDLSCTLNKTKITRRVEKLWKLKDS